MKPITPRRGRDSRRSRDARIGFSLVEVLVAMTVMVVAVVGAIGFAVGREHTRFLTCYDFSVAGASEPEDCARE